MRNDTSGTSAPLPGLHKTSASSQPPKDFQRRPLSQVHDDDAAHTATVAAWTGSVADELIARRRAQALRELQYRK
jgi:hypothetical protein